MMMMMMMTFSGSTAVRGPSAVNPGENSYKPNMLWNHSSLATFLTIVVPHRTLTHFICWTHFTFL